MSLHYQFIHPHPTQARPGYKTYHVKMESPIMRAAFQELAGNDATLLRLAQMPGMSLCIHLPEYASTEGLAKAICGDRAVMMGFLMASRGQIAGNNKCDHCREGSTDPFVSCFKVPGFEGCASCWVNCVDQTEEYGCVKKE